MRYYNLIANGILSDTILSKAAGWAKFIYLKQLKINSLIF